MAEVLAGQPAPGADAPPTAAVIPAAPIDGTAPPVEKTPPAEPPKTFSQEQLDEILEKRLGKERRKREELRRELDVTRKLALQRDEPRKDPAKPEAAEPKREDFESYESFIEAKAEWRADQRVDQRLAKQREESERTRTQEEQQKLDKQFQAEVRKMSAEVDGLDDDLASSEAPLTEAMHRAITSCDPLSLGVKVLHHLTKHPEEAERIAALPAPRQAAEIGKLEAKLSVETPPKKPSQAPEPIKPVGAGSGVQTGIRPGMSFKEFRAERNKQLGRK